MSRSISSSFWLLVFFILLLPNSSFARYLHHERYYQERFCELVHGQLEYKLPDRTRIDCLTSTYAFEVDFGRKAFEAVGQALYYAMMTGKKPAIVLIQETKADNRYIGRIKKLAKRYDIAVFVMNRKFEVRNISE